MKWLPAVLVAVALGLAGTAGGLAVSATGQQATRTVTINVPTGERGPPGPPGPQGPAGLACPSGYAAGKLVINHPGGQTAIWTCLQS